ncbi:MAG: DUF4296 domain-containing protein [Bacteroidota bacterium]
MKRKFYLKPARRNRLILLSFTVLFLIFTACGKEKPDEDILVKVYVENLIVEEKYTVNADSILSRKKAVFSKYKITQQDFEEALKNYSDDLKKWESFFKKANAYLDNLKKNNIIN